MEDNGFVSCNPKVNERVQESAVLSELAVRAGFKQDNARSMLSHMAVAGERSADEILQDDGLVSAWFPCTDLSTLLMAVLRRLRVPCRFVQLFRLSPGHSSQTSGVEVQIQGEIYWVHYSPLRKGCLDVVEGCVESALPDVPTSPLGETLKGFDVWDVDIDVRTLTVLCYLAGKMGGMSSGEVREVARRSNLQVPF